MHFLSFIAVSIFVALASTAPVNPEPVGPAHAPFPPHSGPIYVNPGGPNHPVGGFGGVNPGGPIIGVNPGGPNIPAGVNPGGPMIPA
jgi:hypothetical protein